MEETITFQEIIDKMSNAEDYETLYEAADLIVDSALRQQVKDQIQTCEDDGDSVEVAYSITTTDLLDDHVMSDDKNIEVIEEAKSLTEKASITVTRNVDNEEQALDIVNDASQFKVGQEVEVRDWNDKVYKVIKTKDVKYKDGKKIDEQKEIITEDKDIIWTSEYNNDDEFTQSQYDEYVQNYTPSSPKSFEEWKEDYFNDESNFDEEYEVNIEDYSDAELKEMYQDYVDNYVDKGPSDIEKWKEGFYQQDSESQWEVKSEDLTNNVFPMIEQQCNNNTLILLGSVGRWNGNFNAGKIIHADEEEFRDIMSKYDIVTLYSDDDQISVDFDHHDGTDTMTLFTLPKSDEDIVKLARAMNYEDAVKEEYDLEGTESKEEIDDYILTEFNSDMNYDAIDVEELGKYSDLLVKIQDNIKTESLEEDFDETEDFDDKFEFFLRSNKNEFENNNITKGGTGYEDAIQDLKDNLNDDFYRKGHEHFCDLTLEAIDEWKSKGLDMYTIYTKLYDAYDSNSEELLEENVSLDKDQEEARKGMIDQLIKTGMPEENAIYAVDKVIELLLQGLKTESLDDYKDKITIAFMGRIFEQMRKNGWDGAMEDVEKYFNDIITKIDTKSQKDIEREALTESSNVKMLISVESGLNSDGFSISILDGDNELFSERYNYGYDASYSREGAKYAQQSYEDNIKHGGPSIYYSLKPYVQDIIEDLMKKYNVDKNNIQVVPRKNVFAGKAVDSSEVTEFINDYVIPINESKKLESLLNEEDRGEIEIEETTDNIFDKAQATLPLDNYHSMGIILSDDGETVQYMYSNENKVYESDIEYDEEGNAFFKDENGEKYMINDFLKTNYSNDKPFLTDREKKIFDDMKNQEEVKTSYDYIQDRIGQQITVGEFNSLLQNLFNKYDHVFLLASQLYNVDDIEDSQEVVVFDDGDMYTIKYEIVDLDKGIISITDVNIE